MPSLIPDSLKITNGGLNLPSKAIFYGVPGVGKTAVATCSAKPIFTMTRGENGLLTLLDNGIIRPTDHFPEVADWSTLLKTVDLLLLEDTGHKTYVMDTLNGAERLCFEYVAERSFDGNWEKFSAYGKGPEASIAEWNELMRRLHKLNHQRRMSILLLAHCRVKTFKNPEGEDYDRYSPEMHDKTWGCAEKWADMVLFMNYQTWAKKERGALKAKGLGGANRLFFTQRTAAYDAKSRLGLPSEIPMGDTAQDAWNNLAGHVRAAKKRQAEPAVPATEPGAVNAPAANGTPSLATADAD